MKLATDKQVIDRLRRLRRWIRRHLPTKKQSVVFLTVLVTVSGSLLTAQKLIGLGDTLTGWTYFVFLVTTGLLKLASGEAVDEALHTPAPPDTDETQPAARFGAGREGEG